MKKSQRRIYRHPDPNFGEVRIVKKSYATPGLVLTRRVKPGRGGSWRFIPNTDSYVMFDQLVDMTAEFNLIAAIGRPL